MATDEGCEFWQRTARELESGDIGWEDSLWDGEVGGSLAMIEEEEIYFWDEEDIYFSDEELEDLELDGGRVVPVVFDADDEEDGDGNIMIMMMIGIENL